MYILKLLLWTFFDPIRAFNSIKEHTHKKELYIAPCILIPLCVLAKILSLYCTSFPFTTQNVVNINIFYQITGLILPITSIVVGVYLITAVNDGEVYFYQMLSAMSFSLVPYTIFTAVLTGLSYVVSFSAASFHTIEFIVWVWVYLLLFMSILIMNSYKFFQAIKVVILGILTAIFLWVVLLILFILAENITSFLSECIKQNVRYFHFKR